MRLGGLEACFEVQGLIKVAGTGNSRTGNKVVQGLSLVSGVFGWRGRWEGL